MEITQAATALLKQIFRQGIHYKKAGVILSDIHPSAPMQLNFFDPIANRPERNTLMKAIDGLNQRYGIKSVHLAGEGDMASPWKVKCEHKSANYLTDIRDILTVRICKVSIDTLHFFFS